MTITATDLSEAEQLIEQGFLDDLLDGMSEGEAAELACRWRFWRRPSQTVPKAMGLVFQVWLVLAGRGFGKTRTGAETTREVVEWAPRIALVGPTAGDVRDTMIEGESGIMSVFPRHQRPDYEPSKLRVTFHTGTVAGLFSAEKPDRLRGPQHYWGWLDEPGTYPLGQLVWDNFSLGLRLGRTPWALLTSTPKRQARWMRELADEAETTITSGNTYQNYANLSAVFISRVVKRYEGTRLGRQELHAEWLDDVEGALWTQQAIDLGRIDTFDHSDPGKAFRKWCAESGRPVQLDRRAWRIIVAVDPPGETAECGIIVGCAPVGGVAGVDHAVVLADESMSGRPEDWGAAVVAAYRHWGAQAVFVEKNQGGDMVRSTVHAVDATVPVRKITARESKQARAEPIAALYGKDFVHHVGFMVHLEDQQTSWVPPPIGTSRSPDRLDAVVHLCRELLEQRDATPARVRTHSHRRV